MAEIRTIPKHIPIFRTEIPKQDSVIELARQGVFELQEKLPTRIKSNVKASYVSPLTDNIDNTKFKPICDYVLSFCEDIAKTYFNRDLEFEIFSLWGMIYEPYDYAVKHDHFPSTLAAVVYLDMQDDAAPIVFENDHKIYPSTGTVIVFPGILSHEVPLTTSKRMVIGMNINHVISRMNRV